MDDDTEVFVACRAQLALPELDGSSEAVLREHFSALASVFLAYATSHSDGSPLLLARADFETMLHDCRLMQRVGASVLPKHVDAVWARLAAAGPTEPPEPPLDMPRFLEALLLLSRVTAATTATSAPAAAGSTASAASKRPPPPAERPSDRLQALLRPLLAHAHRDDASIFRAQLATDGARQQVLLSFDPSLRQLFARLVAASQLAAPRGQAKAAALRNAFGPAPRVTPAAFSAMLDAAGLLGRVRVQGASAVTGDPRAKRRYDVELSAADARRIYKESVGARALLPARPDGASRAQEWADLSYAGFQANPNPYPNPSPSPSPSPNPNPNPNPSRSRWRAWRRRCTATCPRCRPTQHCQAWCGAYCA